MTPSLWIALGLVPSALLFGGLFVRSEMRRYRLKVAKRVVRRARVDFLEALGRGDTRGEHYAYRDLKRAKTNQLRLEMNR